MKTYYDILGVSSTCDRDALKKAYHNLVREYHPDKNVDGATSFRLIDEAWKTLSDVVQRRVYDAELKAAENCTSRPVHEEVRLEDMTKKSDCFEKDCRCGGLYVLYSEDICDDGLIAVDCDNCSLSVVVDCTPVNKRDDS